MKKVITLMLLLVTLIVTQSFAQSLAERFLISEILEFGTPVKFNNQVYILNNSSQKGLYSIRINKMPHKHNIDIFNKFQAQSN